MFCDLVGSTALSTRLDPEDLREVIAAYHERVTATVRRFQGYVAQYLGDGALIYFGYPHATENDAEHAVRAALAVIAAVADLDTHEQRLAVRVGIATGSVVVGAIGPVANPEHGAIGETPNLAARLQALAEPNAVVVAASTRLLTGSLFAYRDLGRHDFKGFVEPIQAWQVLGASTESRFEALRWSHAPLAGRRLELEQLRTVLNACTGAGRGRAVYIRGEAGIGKTRLLEEMLSVARQQGFACHTGLVLDFGTGIGSDAIAALARDILELPPKSNQEMVQAAIEKAIASGLVARNDEVFLDDLLEVPQPMRLRAVYDAMDNSTRSTGKRRTIARLVEQSSRVQPRVLAVEDLHWADGLTLTHLAALAATVAVCPAVLVMTSRVEQDPLDRGWRAEAGAGALIAIDLAPLHAEEAAILAAPYLDANAEVAKRCVERAAGNPLFLEQLLRNALEGDGSAIPGSVQSLVQARLDRLDASDKAALQAASVLGQRFDRGALAHLLDEPDYDPKRLLTRLMVQTHGDEFLFAHALIHEAVYEGLLKSRRRELHRRAADWFAPRDASLYASHLDRAGDPAAARAYLEAARAQTREYRYDAAKKLVERGLDLASGQADRFALSCLLGDTLIDLGEMSAALAAFDRALTAAGSDAERCRAWIGRAWVKRVTDDLDGAFADLEHAEAVAVALGLKIEEAQLRFLRGNLCFPRGDIEGCLREHGRSLELARTVGAPELEAEALGGLGDAEYMRGRMISAHRHFQDCIVLAARHGLGRIGSANRPMAAFTRWFAGEIDGALADARAAIEAAKLVGHKRAEMVAHHAAYFCLHDRAEFDAAAKHATQSLLIAQQLHAPRFEAEGLAFRAELERLASRRLEAQSNIQAALAISRRSGMAFIGPIILGTLARTAEDEAARREALFRGRHAACRGSGQSQSSVVRQRCDRGVPRDGRLGSCRTLCEGARGIHARRAASVVGFHRRPRSGAGRRRPRPVVLRSSSRIATPLGGRRTAGLPDGAAGVAPSARRRRGPHSMTSSRVLRAMWASRCREPFRAPGVQ
jgi:class 3 adenylate cyclase/tetratricopeptide (TPR) repeat protein